MVSYFHRISIQRNLTEGGDSMGQTIKVLEAINYIVSIIISITCNIRSFSKEQIAVAVIILIVLTYITISIFLYENSKKESLLLQ